MFIRLRNLDIYRLEEVKKFTTEFCGNDQMTNASLYKLVVYLGDALIGVDASGGYEIAELEELMKLILSTPPATSIDIHAWEKGKNES